MRNSSETVKTPRTFRLTAYWLGLAGAALLTWLVIRNGAGDVITVVASAGWGLAAIAVLHVAKMTADTLGWLMVISPSERPRLRTALWIHWLGESVSDLLPTARIGGDIITVRLAALKGVPLKTALASMLVDVTTCVFAKVVYTIAGLLLLVLATGQTNLVGPGLTAVLTGILAVGGFYIVQRFGIFRWSAALASRLAQSSRWDSLTKSGEALDQAVHQMYGRKGGILACFIFAILSWMIGAGEIWITLLVLGIPTDFTTPLILESVAQAVRGAMFFVPGALGVQESGYLVTGGMLGIPGEIALALSLIRRVREMMLGIPGLLVWQLIEGRRLWQTASSQVEQETSQGQDDHRFTHVPTRTCR